MSLSSLFHRLRGLAFSAQPEAEQPPLSASDVELTRVRARRRLIGMVVLVGAGVIGFPWLFETQPRAMSPDVTMVRVGDAESPEAVKGRVRTASDKVALSQEQVPVAPEATDEEDEVIEEELITTRPVAPLKRDAKPESKPPVKAKPEPEPTPKPVTKSEPKPAPKAEAVASKTEKKPEVEPKPAATDSTRYVVQFGAFSDGITAHEARMKVERLGLKTYTQEVKTANGTRIRVRMGPYANRVEAEKVLTSLRKSGLNGAVLTL